MNKIEAKEVRQAIIYYNIRLREAERNGYSSRGEIATALKALQEQAERDKGCEYCQPKCHNCKHDVYNDFCRYYGSHGCGNLYYTPKHKYCPNCGAKMERE